jgi:hypothetical protein
MTSLRRISDILKERGDQPNGDTKKTMRKCEEVKKMVVVVVVMGKRVVEKGRWRRGGDGWAEGG